MARVVVIGPNLPRSDESFHVHAAGCSDIYRSLDYRSHEFDSDKANAMEFNSVEEIAEYVYADQIAEGGYDAADLINDFRIFPCVHIMTYTPKKETPVVDTKTVTVKRKITFEIYNSEMFFEAEMTVDKSDLDEALSQLRAIRNVRNIRF